MSENTAFPSELISLPALSIRQPWASSIIYLGKDVENRAWFTRFRGRVLVHASKTITNDDIAGWNDHIRIRKLSTRELASRYRTCRDFPRGGIVGVAEIVNCVSRPDSPWFVGPWGFVLRNVRPLPFLPCKGTLGFFFVNEGGSHG